MTFDEFLEKVKKIDPKDYGNHLQQMRLFARELAWGATERFWGTKFWITRAHDSSMQKYKRFEDLLGESSNYREFYDERWLSIKPDEAFLESFGYVVEGIRHNGDLYYLLTHEAFDLLEKPAVPPTIFISYKRSESLLFALFIEARLRQRGIAGVFVDKDIRGGDEWKKMIQDNAYRCDTLILLLAPNTLISPWVRNEINWSQEKNTARIIPIVHKGFDEKKMTEESGLNYERWNEIKGKHWLEIFDIQEDENGELNVKPTIYDNLINELLSALGYSTL